MLVQTKKIKFTNGQKIKTTIQKGIQGVIPSLRPAEPLPAPLSKVAKLSFWFKKLCNVLKRMKNQFFDF